MVTIKGIPTNSIIIKLDRFPQLDSFFTCSDNNCKKADYAIVTQNETTDETRVIFIEMKSGTGNNQKIIQQLKGAACLLEYCKQLGKMFWAESFLDTYQCKYVSIAAVYLARHKNLDVSGGSNHKPHKYRKIKAREIHFSKL